MFPRSAFAVYVSAANCLP